MKTWLLLTAFRKLLPPCPMVLSPTSYDLPFSYRFTVLPHDCHRIVPYDSLRSSKVNDLYVIWKLICDFLLVINSNLDPISHRLATIHPWRTDRQADKQTDGQTDNNHANSLTVRSAKKEKKRGETEIDGNFFSAQSGVLLIFMSKSQKLFRRLHSMSALGWHYSLND